VADLDGLEDGHRSVTEVPTLGSDAPTVDAGPGELRVEVTL
jgi:hypothetical protein